MEFWNEFNLIELACGFFVFFLFLLCSFSTWFFFCFGGNCPGKQWIVAARTKEQYGRHRHPQGKSSSGSVAGWLPGCQRVHDRPEDGGALCACSCMQYPDLTVFMLFFFFFVKFTKGNFKLWDGFFSLEKLILAKAAACWYFHQSIYMLHTCVQGVCCICLVKVYLSPKVGRCRFFFVKMLVLSSPHRFLCLSYAIICTTNYARWEFDRLIFLLKLDGNSSFSRRVARGRRVFRCSSRRVRKHVLRTFIWHLL